MLKVKAVNSTHLNKATIISKKQMKLKSGVFLEWQK